MLSSSYKLLIILNYFSIYFCFSLNENITTTESISSRMIPNNYNMMYSSPLSSSASSSLAKFSFPYSYGIRYSPTKPIDPLLLAPHVIHGIVPMALSFSVGYFLLRLLTIGLFFAEKAFPYGHYRIDDKNTMSMDNSNMANVWRRIDSSSPISMTSSQKHNSIPLLLQLYNKALDKYNYFYDEQKQQQIDIKNDKNFD